MNYYNLIRKLAKGSKYQNLFATAKEINGIFIFINKRDISKLQSIFLNYLFMYDRIYQDLASNRVSEHVCDCELFEDSYLLWQRHKIHKPDNADESTSEISLVAGDTITFPKQKEN